MRLYELKDGTYLDPKIVRRCKWDCCKTILADKNPNDYCFAHLRRGIEKDFEERKRKPKHARITPLKKKKIRV